MALKSKSKETEENAENTDTNTNTQDGGTQTSERETQSEKSVAVRKPAGALSLAGGKSVFITNPDFLSAVVDAEYGTFPSVVASNGAHMMGEVNLGKEIKFQGIVQKDVWKVTPGSNDDEAKDYFAVSHDGETTTKGVSLEDALQEALDAGYSKAAIKKYIDIICVLVDCDSEAHIGETITLQLAPSSVFAWKPIAGRVKMRAAMGKLEATPIMGDPELGSAVVFTSTAEPTKVKGNNFTKFLFSV